MIDGRKIKKIRIILKKNQKEMAKELGISQSYLCEIEKGTKKPNGNTVIRLLNNFNVSCEWLISGVGPVFIDNKNLFYVKAADMCEEDLPYNFPILKHYLKKAIDVDALNLSFYNVESNNMAPLIKEGDTVFIDTSKNLCDLEGIYLFKTESKKFLGRLLFSPEKHVTSDNPLVGNGSKILDSTIECIGKVVWCWGRV